MDCQTCPAPQPFDVDMSDDGEAKVYCTAAVMEDISRRLGTNNQAILLGLDILTPMKVRLYFPSGMRFHPEIYQMWRQSLLDARGLHVRARATRLSVRQFIVQTRDAEDANGQQWKHIETKEKAQTIMLGWLERDLNELDVLLTTYALGFEGFPQGTGFVGRIL